jgi:hypothetical protein
MWFGFNGHRLTIILAEVLFFFHHPIIHFLTGAYNKQVFVKAVGYVLRQNSQRRLFHKVFLD